MIRIARDGDAAAIAAIYAPTVTDSVITFETQVPDAEAMRQRVADRLAHYPWLVLEDQGRVLGYAYASRFRDRAAYDWICETSVYVHPDARRRGVARRLYTALLDTLAMQGITQALSVITLPGQVSIALHERFGFVHTGTWYKAGYKLGQWHDVGVWQKQLAEPATPPTPVIAFAELAEREDWQASLNR
ncbi:GNAT family N-acetyltransferase [Oleiagrimonas sp. C23AA]|uniref:GNAT family N-acetyltransferase n=1 Tax=Oleiagrimonas sp. C23AA TaxID=2719047 RepID=UPI00142092E1|nr:GNAT family N-acetyltransferase [Oleiagrimonas sp. C23AA]NII09347.1 N-acetyltransferase [Oleiagrimonas sp. C23AA]